MVRISGPESMLDFVLNSELSISGRVSDEDGKAVEGAVVSSFASEDNAVATDSEGRYALHHIDGQRAKFGVYVRAPGFVFANAWLDSDPDGSMEQDFVLDRGVRVEGRVTHEDGSPVAGARLYISELERYSASWSQGRQFTHTEGEWSTKNEELLPGAVMGIEVTAEGYSMTTATRVVVSTDPDPDDLVLRMFAGSSVRGRVVEAGTGAPVTGALVKRYTDYDPVRYWNEGETRDAIWSRTDANGYFELTNVPGEAMSLAVGRPEWKSTYDGPFDVQVGASTPFRLIEMRRGGVLVGVNRAERERFGVGSISMASSRRTSWSRPRVRRGMPRRTPNRTASATGSAPLRSKAASP